jgi:hypothetical protein
MQRLSFLLLVGLIAGCAREPALFVDTNARAHIGMLAGTIGSRPVGTPANARARDYIVDQLKQIGFEVRVQEADARRHELGRTARVANIIGVLRGERPEAIGLVTHYDSSPDAPGATDAALGVGIALETARVFAASGRKRWSMFVIATDGEESGLMGAAALVTDREVMERLRAYLNLESVGSAGTAVLFETGPGNSWLVSPWARRAPHPRGGSYALEVYQRLPNDTDFSILKTRDIPGLNFAPIGDSYAYHTARDTPERLARETIQRSGENISSIVTALQDVDITQRATQTPTYLDIGGTVAVSYRPVVHWLLAAAALLLGVIAWVRLTADAVRVDGMLRWLTTFMWAWLGAAAVCGSMIGATWLLRLARTVYHPWYARPGRLFVLLIVIGMTVGWSMARLGQWLPRRVHPTRHSSLTWSVALPGWIVLTALALWFAPSAAYLWVLPLLAAGLLLAPVAPRRDALVRICSLLVLAVSGSLWVPETHDLLRFVVAVMGRLPMVTPVVAYAALLTLAGAMIVPPLVALLASGRPLVRPWVLTSLLLLATAAASAAAYVAPAYTSEQPLRRHVRALQDGNAATATWEVASVEPGLDLNPDAPAGWMPATSPVPNLSIPWGQYRFPFVFRAAGPALGPAPVTIAALTITPVAEGTQIAMSVVPREPGLTVSFVLPPGMAPARSNLPGVQRLRSWTATFIAPPPEGIAWEATFRGPVGDQLRDTRIAVTSPRIPGGQGWQSLPGWLPQDAAVWSAAATWIVSAASVPTIAPVPPLR